MSESDNCVLVYDFIYPKDAISESVSCVLVSVLR